MVEIPEKVSLIVIGGGITGLSTAIAWAINNPCSTHPVLVFEKEPAAGGYVTSFKRGGYLFDTVQIIPDSIPTILARTGLKCAPRLQTCINRNSRTESGHVYRQVFR